jgi:hypothetical protein
VPHSYSNRITSRLYPFLEVTPKSDTRKTVFKSIGFSGIELMRAIGLDV